MKQAILYLLILLTLGCKTQEPTGALKLSPRHQVFLLDSLQAGTVITTDDKEGFFEKARPLDMCLQMKKKVPVGASREEILAEYRAFLRRDVEDFETEERALLIQVMKRAYEACRKLNPSIFPDSVLLIKTKGRHYGPSVYYTREKAIVIPEGELAEGREEQLYQVLLHELFHIYSRYNEAEQQALYRMIGFEPLPMPPYVPDSLDARVLLNPDGVNWRYSITLDSLEAVPLISSALPDFDPARPAFFNYLDFQLYPIQFAEDLLIVQARNGHQSPLPPPARIPAFFEQAGDNTNYIIHPDEILADNFVILVTARAAGTGLNPNQYSARGLEVLRTMESIIGSFSPEKD